MKAAVITFPGSNCDRDLAVALAQAGADGAPVLIDKFLAGAIEVDVDVVADYDSGRDGETKRRRDEVGSNVSDSSRAIIAGIMEQIEQAGIHSGDSACTLPPASLSTDVIARIEKLGKDMARELRVNGLMNLQLAVKDDEIFVIEVNPRASRTVPLVGKATHTPWSAIAAKVMMGKKLSDLVAARSSRSEERNGLAGTANLLRACQSKSSIASLRSVRISRSWSVDNSLSHCSPWPMMFSASSVLRALE